MSGIPELGDTEEEWRKAMDYLFATHAKKYKRNGVIYVKCKKNLWRVSGTDLGSVTSEAKRYFIQYLLDGEYS
jgi:N-acetylneuraminic acid mutarotase